MDGTVNRVRGRGRRSDGGIQGKSEEAISRCRWCVCGGRNEWPNDSCPGRSRPTLRMNALNWGKVESGVGWKGIRRQSHLLPACRKTLTESLYIRYRSGRPTRQVPPHGLLLRGVASSRRNVAAASNPGRPFVETH